jgi:hypothetical protein
MDASICVHPLTRIVARRPTVKFTREGGAIELRVDVVHEAPPAAVAAAAAAAAASSAAAPRASTARSSTASASSDGSWRSTPLPALPQRWLRFQVVDTGIGVDADALARIFLPFVQESDSTVREFGGTGLGLTARLSRKRCCVREAYVCCTGSDAITHCLLRRSVSASRARWAAR